MRLNPKKAGFPVIPKHLFLIDVCPNFLQELMTNFRNIIVPEAIKSFTSGDPSVIHMLENLERLVCGEDVAALVKTVEKEMNGKHDSQVCFPFCMSQPFHHQYDHLHHQHHHHHHHHYHHHHHHFDYSLFLIRMSVPPASTPRCPYYSSSLMPSNNQGMELVRQFFQ